MTGITGRNKLNIRRNVKFIDNIHNNFIKTDHETMQIENEKLIINKEI